MIFLVNSNPERPFVSEMIDWLIDLWREYSLAALRNSFSSGVYNCGTKSLINEKRSINARDDIVENLELNLFNMKTFSHS